MLEITDSEFKEEVLESDLPVLAYFSAVWCGPCRAAGPVLEELAKEYEGKVKFVKINVDENSQTPQKYGVMSIPTVVMFKGGKEADREVGFGGKEGYQKLLEEVLA